MESNGVVVVFDTEEETSRVRALPEGVTPGQLVWKPNSEIVVGVGYPSKPYRIGIAYCSDRESFLFSVDQNGVYEELTPRGQHVKNPRFSPSGENLVYFQSTIYGERAPAAQLALIKWSSRQSEILVDYVKVSKLIHNEKSFVGVCGKSILPRRCFDVSEKKIFFSAYKISNYVTYIINTETKEIFELTDPNEYSSVQDVYKDWILLLKSSLTEPDRIYLCKFNSVGNSLEKYLPITSERSLKNVEKDWVNVLEFQSPIKDKFGQELTVTALYLGPKAGMEKRPLICWPHGGPHSVIGNRFTHAIAFFLNIGYSILLPNYRGSIGHGNDFLTASLGQCGDADVQDCFQSIEEVLKRFKDTVSEG
ncbi:Acylamino-acid-releasing enzyme [Armadillidium vulgare]|nr:Acylamino-acid-releasing enzyme [Armadillidium vulgare]